MLSKIKFPVALNVLFREINIFHTYFDASVPYNI